MRVAIALAIAGCSDTGRPMTTLAPKSDLAQWIQSLYIQVTMWDAMIFAIVIVAFILAVFVFSSRVGEAAPPRPRRPTWVLKSRGRWGRRWFC